MSTKWIIIIVLLTFVGCSKDPQEVNIYSIPDEFKVDLHQAVSNEGTYPAFRISTIDTKSCTNDEIIITVAKVGSNVRVNILDLNEADECNNQSGKLWTDVYVALQPGIYPLSITLKDQISNKGLITVTEKDYSISLNTDHGIKIGKTRVLKIPDDLIWGYSITQPGISSSWDDIMNQLSPYIQAPPLLDFGDYGLFEILDNNNYVLNSNPGQSIDSQFLNKLETGISEIRTIVNRFKEDNPQAEFKIYTSRGIVN